MSLTIYMQYLIAMQYLGLTPCTREQMWREIQEFTSRDADPFSVPDQIDYLVPEPRERPEGLKWEVIPFGFHGVSDSLRDSECLQYHSDDCGCPKCCEALD